LPVEGSANSQSQSQSKRYLNGVLCVCIVRKPIYVYFARVIELLSIKAHLTVCRAKHPVKVHVWAGISLQGRTGICIFEGIMDAPLYIQILNQTLLPFIRDVYPGSHRFLADNDPKHTSKAATKFLEEKRVNWWQTPAESPDLNPIENMWHELRSTCIGKSSPRTSKN